MPRKITDAFTFDACEDELIFTRFAIKADPDATDFLPVTEGWLGLVDDARARDRAARIAVAEASAARTVTNGRLDDHSKAFGDELHVAVKKDHASARWKRFFPQHRHRLHQAAPRRPGRRRPRLAGRERRRGARPQAH